MSDQNTKILRAEMATLADEMVRRQYNVDAAVWTPYGIDGRQKSLRDQEYHLSYLAESVDADDFSLFEKYLEWAKILFHQIKLPEDALQKSLQTARDVLHERRDNSLAKAIEYLERGISLLEDLPDESPSHIVMGEQLGNLARQYLDLLLEGERTEASKLILEQVSRREDVKNIYLKVFQPVQQEIGRLWQHNEISVAREHYCTAATQLVMSQLYPYIFSTERKGLSMVASCVGGELHEIGLHFISDFFEMEGWDTYYLGANVPARDIVKEARDRRASLVCLSATLTMHVSRVTQVIQEIRNVPELNDVKILVGGYPFNISPNLWQKVGADLYAPGPTQALQLTERMLAS